MRTNPQPRAIGQLDDDRRRVRQRRGRGCRQHDRGCKPNRHSALSYEHAGKIEAQLQAEVADLMVKAEAADQSAERVNDFDTAGFGI